ncbi:FliH/SctL family protein [Dyella subtropica]|uniref:FliH/SctL family protein n=1 Tax=Dyella subtropica TaxID=2992127 RepID=UPI00224D1163|nr:FliH/SctL family protein [Dyella subtropica]
MNALVADQDRFQMYLETGVIPAAAWTPLTEAQRIVEQANALLRQAEIEREQIFAQAKFDGLVEGRERGLRECAQALQALAQARTAATEALRKRASDIAIGVVKHIAPAIGAERLVSSLVAEAMQKLVFEPHLLVRVHPDIVVQARSEVAALGAAAAPDIEIIGDADLDRFDCIIESAGGIVRAGFNEQLEQARVILAAAEKTTGGRRERADA